MNYSKHVVKFNLFNAFRNRYPIDNFEFIETNMRPWGAVQDKSDSFILKNLKILLVKFLKTTKPCGACIIEMTLN